MPLLFAFFAFAPPERPNLVGCDAVAWQFAHDADYEVHVSPSRRSFVATAASPTAVAASRGVEPALATVSSVSLDSRVVRDDDPLGVRADFPVVRTRTHLNLESTKGVELRIAKHRDGAKRYDYASWRHVWARLALTPNAPIISEMTGAFASI